MNRIIPSSVHGFLNYFVAIISISSPWLFGFNNAHGAVLFIPMYFGVLQLVLSIFTNYEAGLIKSAPVQLHYSLDILVGFFVMVSPLLYGFCDVQFWPHFLLGLYTLLSGLLSVVPPTHHFSDFKASS